MTSSDLPRLHLITDDAVLRSDGFLSQVDRLLGHGGPSMALHLRGNGLTGAELWNVADECARAARRTHAWLVINDRVDIASACGANAIQLGRRSLPIPAARAIAGSAISIGASVHDSAQLSAAVEGGADFMVAGTVYGTPSHPGITPSGVPWVKEVAMTGAPVIAIGGITVDRVREVRDAGAYGVAVIRAVWNAADPAVAVDQLLTVLE